MSVVTLGELKLGVINADDDAIRARRADTLALARAADPPSSGVASARCALLGFLSQAGFGGGFSAWFRPRGEGVFCDAKRNEVPTRVA